MHGRMWRLRKHRKIENCMDEHIIKEWDNEGKGKEKKCVYEGKRGS